MYSLLGLGVNWQDVGHKFGTGLGRNTCSTRHLLFARLAQHHRAAGSCCGSSQPREGTYPQPYRLDKALVTSQYPWDRVHKDLHVCEGVSPPLPGACIAASSSERFALSK